MFKSYLCRQGLKSTWDNIFIITIYIYQKCMFREFPIDLVSKIYEISLMVNSWDKMSKVNYAMCMILTGNSASLIKIINLSFSYIDCMNANIEQTP